MWYKTGTIALTNGSAAVTGTGTAWLANATAGEAILCPDGRFYEVASVNTDTSITLASAYTGSSLSGQAYTILPSQSFIRDLASQVTALISSYSTIASNAGAGKFGDGIISAPGICFTADTDTGIRRTASGTFALVSNGADVLSVAPAGVSITGTASISGILTSNSGSIVANNSTAGASTFILMRDNGSAKFNLERDGSNNLKFNYNESGSSTVFTLSTTGAAVTGTLSATGDITGSSGIIWATKSGTPQLNLTNSSGTTKNAQIIYRDSVGIRWRVGTDISTNNGTNAWEVYDEGAAAARLTVNTSGVSVKGAVATVGTAATSLVSFSSTGTTTAKNYLTLSNTSGSVILGIEGSAAEGIAIGTSAYDAVISGQSGISFSGNNGGGTQLRISSAGLAAAVALNSASGLTVTNSSAGDGSLSQARVSTINNAGTTGYMTTTGSAFTTSGVFSAGNTYFGASAGNTYVHSAGGTVNLSVGTAAILSASGTGVTITQANNQAALKLTNGPSANNIGLTLESSGGNVVINNGNGPLEVSVGGSLRLNVATNGDFYGVAGTTGMTGGFIHVPSAAGAPTGAPTAHSGRTPIYYDTTNNKLYAYNGAWKASGVFA